MACEIFNATKLDYVKYEKQPALDPKSNQRVIQFPPSKLVSSLPITMVYG